MQAEPRATQTYQQVLKAFKAFVILGELATIVIRILSQAVFSVYIGFLLVQFIFTIQIYFRTYSVAESRFYIIMNFLLMYLLVINFVENLTTKSQAIQTIIKDKYIVDYTRIGYPLEFLFRVLAIFLIWRLYQFSKMKTFQYGDVLPNEEQENIQSRRDVVHVRQNTREQAFSWGLNSSRNDNENSRNSYVDRTHSNYIPSLRQIDSRLVISQRGGPNEIHAERPLHILQPEIRVSNHLQHMNNVQNQTRVQIGADRISPHPLNRPIDTHNQNQMQYTNFIQPGIHSQQLPPQNMPVRRP